jgi:Ser/Thr protein kinase RdoA (MazF antagonist)
MSEPTDSFYALGPEQVLQAVESIGFACDGHQLALNSYENRVYQVGIVASKPVIAKFYRPSRWKDEAILEEHRFTLDLAALEIPVVPPLELDGETLHTFGSYRFALYPLRGGRAPNLENPDHLEQLGRFLGRIHALGASEPFQYRPRLSIEHFGDDSCSFLLGHGFIPTELETVYERLAEGLLDEVDVLFERAGNVAQIRLHGDCHPGNILWTDSGPHIVDFDDARTGPAAQDMWMFISGERPHMQARLADLLKGYIRFYDFDVRELNLIEALRTLRMMHYAAWLARRWDDPAFKRTFPWFNTQNYWEEHILSLKEQAALMHEEPLQWI